MSFFSNEKSNSLKITLGDENNISNEEKIASIFNKYFINQTKSLNFKKQISLRNGDRNDSDGNTSIKNNT